MCHFTETRGYNAPNFFHTQVFRDKVIHFAAKIKTIATKVAHMVKYIKSNSYIGDSMAAEMTKDDIWTKKITRRRDE